MAKKTVRRKTAAPAPAPKPSAVTAAFRGGRRRPAGRQEGYPPFITADDLAPGQPEKFKVLPSISLFVRNDGTASLFIQIQRRGGEVFTFGLNSSGPDRISLQQQIGRNLVEWPGQIIVLHAQRGTRGGHFVNVYDPSYHRAPGPAAFDDADTDDIPF